MLFESLESRQLMSVSLNAATGLLTVNGKDDPFVPDTIVVKATPTAIQVSDNGVNVSYLKSKVKKIAIYAKGGADQVTVDASVFLPTFIDSGAGGVAGPGDKIQGGSGNDTIKMYAFDGTAKGGAGNDTLELYNIFGDIYGEGGNDTLVNKNISSTESGFYGGAGIDTIDYSTATADIVLQNGPTGPYDPDYIAPNPYLHGVATDTVSAMENFYGGSGDDYIYGTTGNNVIAGNGGNDVIKGNAGDDTLYGGNGNDNIHGNAGNDTVWGGAGEDAMFGDDGNDTFYSQDGTKDFLSGGNGWDKRHSDALDILNSVEASF